MIVSLFDYTGNWCQPYRDAGYDVVQVDIQHGSDVYAKSLDRLINVQGVLAAPPCTDFAASGARWFAAKDADGRTERSCALVHRTLDLIEKWQPAWWALENPIGRIRTLIPQVGFPVMSFDPCNFGDPRRKRSLLYGAFNANLVKTPVEPEGIRPGQPGTWYSRVGGASLKTKNYRSATSVGFAKAFFEANP